MDAAYLSALSALAGSVVGALTSGITTWMTQRAQLKAGHHAHEMSRREDLFRDFIVSTSKAYGHALMNNEPPIEEIVGLYSMVSRMRVLCSPRVAACADQVMQATMDTYFAPNRNVQELHDLVKSGVGLDPLKEFSEAARDDLRAFASLLR